MTKGSRRDEEVDADVFVRFGRLFPSSARWRPYFVRWERQAHVSFDHRWLVRAEVEVTSADRAFVRLFWSSRSRRHASPEGEPGFERLRRDLEGCGYELRAPGSPYWLLLKQFRPTGSLLADARREVEALFWPGERTAGALNGSKGGIAGALRQFSHAPSWKPSCCGWSWRFRLHDDTEVVLAMLLIPRGRRRRLEPDPEVLLFPPLSASRGRLRQLAEACRAVGYQGKFETARPAGHKPFLAGNFERTPITFDETKSERARLDELGRELRRLR